MSDFIGIDASGIKELALKLDRLIDAVGDEGVNTANAYMLDAVKLYPPQKRVTLQEAYGGFISDKQRRYFFAALRDGRIQVPYNRTQTLRNNWRVVGTGKTSFIANDVSYAGLVMGDNEQARMHNLIGWQKLADFISARLPEIIRRFEAGKKKAISKLNLG